MVRSWDVAADLQSFDVRPLMSAERGQLVSFLSALEPDDWAKPTANEGWNVHDVALHLLGNDVGRVSRAHRGAAPTSGEATFQALADQIEQSNEHWVDVARRIHPALLVDLLAFIGPRVDDAFAAVDLDAPGLSVAWTGTGPTPYWLDIAREYTERWVHHAQIRLAVGASPLLERRWLHPVLDAFMRCLPRAYEDVDARNGSTVSVEVAGDAGGVWSVRRAPDRWHLVPDAAATFKPTARVRLDADVAWRLLSRTISPEAALPSIEFGGDATLGLAATRAVAIMTTKL